MIDGCPCSIFFLNMPSVICRISTEYNSATHHVIVGILPNQAASRPNHHLTITARMLFLSVILVTSNYKISFSNSMHQTSTLVVTCTVARLGQRAPWSHAMLSMDFCLTSAVEADISSRVDHADVLGGCNYFFHVRNILQSYPIYPTFRD